jgi:uncharacterized protein with von Willebrand factor type A (vWA) domain
LDRPLEHFITALRRSGVKVSVAETMDALQAVALSGYGDRECLKDFLSVSLAKSLREKDVFEVCFSRFFTGDELFEEDFRFENGGDSPAVQGASVLSRFLISGDGGGLALAFKEAAERAGIRNIQYPTQRGLYMQRFFQELGLESLNEDIQGISKRDDPESLARARSLESMRDHLIERVGNLIERQLELYAAGRADDLSDENMRNTRLTALEERDLSRIHKMVLGMVKHLKDRHSRRQRVARRGRLDFKKTLRKSITYGGLPFEPCWKSKKIDRAEIVVLCDVSRSVAMVVRFFLLILYSLNEVIPKIRSFIFCSNLVDVSPLFQKYTLQEALARVWSGTELPILMNRTDYGVSFVDFKDQYAHCLTKRATMIIMGDARNNYWNPKTEALRYISERCKRLIWLNPETPALWGSGDSEMETYLPYCTVARECSTLRHLEKVVEYLLRVS